MMYHIYKHTHNEKTLELGNVTILLMRDIGHKNDFFLS